MSDICKDDVRLQTAGLPAALLSDARRVDALSIELELETLHLFVLMFVFFFSSRRRHTRWPRDWSSDVCSSDLRRYTVWTPCEPPGLCFRLSYTPREPEDTLHPRRGPADPAAQSSVHGRPDRASHPSRRARRLRDQVLEGDRARPNPEARELEGQARLERRPGPHEDDDGNAGRHALEEHGVLARREAQQGVIDDDE